MRVLIIGPSPEVQGGVSYVIRLMLKHTPQANSYQVLPTIVPHTTVAHLQDKPMKYSFRGIANLLFFVRSLCALRRLTESVDLAHVHFSSKGSTFRKYFVAQVLYKRKIPYLLHAHGARYPEFYQRAPAFVKRCVYWIMCASDGLIVLSEQWRSFYEGLLGDCKRPIWVMSNPVELPPYQEPSASNALKLLFLGRMGERKGPDRILHAVARLPHPLRESVRLYMAGDGDVNAVRQLAVELGLQARADIRDWIEGEEKERWLRETNAFILPSRAEGLPMAMLEAMAWSKALIVSPVGGIPEFVTDEQEGILVPPDDIDAISRAIATLAQYPDLRAQMGRAARARVEPLDVKKYMERMTSIYREVLATNEI